MSFVNDLINGQIDTAKNAVDPIFDINLIPPLSTGGYISPVINPPVPVNQNLLPSPPNIVPQGSAPLPTGYPISQAKSNNWKIVLGVGAAFAIILILSNKKGKRK